MTIDEDTFSVFNIVLEFADVNFAILVDFLGMPVADAVIEVTDQLGGVKERVAAVPCHRRVNELSRVLVTIVKVDQSLTTHEAFSELAFIDSVVVVEVR